jgi:hypothetical protein
MRMTKAAPACECGLAQQGLGDLMQLRRELATVHPKWSEQ